MFWKDNDMCYWSSVKLAGSSKNQNRTNDIRLNRITNATIPKVMLISSANTLTTEVSVLSCTQKQKMILNIDRKVIIRKTRLNRKEMTFYTFINLLDILLDFSYSSIVLYLLRTSAKIIRIINTVNKRMNMML